MSLNARSRMHVCLYCGVSVIVMSLKDRSVFVWLHCLQRQCEFEGSVNVCLYCGVSVVIIVLQAHF